MLNRFSSPRGIATAGIVLAALVIAVTGAWKMSAEAGDAKGNPVVVLETSKGAITIELFADKAPKSVENFLWYVDNKFYDGLVFHRVIPGFMIQGGGFTKDMVQKKTNPAIENEANNGVKNLRGTLAMARTNAIHSATSQFFINLKDNDFLDYQSKANYGYAVFGKVIDGMKVVDAIAMVKTAKKGRYDDVPVTPVIITGASRAEKPKSKPKSES